MKLLIDTQALILAGRDELLKPARALYESPSNDIYFSMASLLEIAIKASLGKLQFKKGLVEYRRMLVGELGLLFVPIEPEHLEELRTLPFHHKDPFDRLLVGQAMVEGLAIFSGDLAFDQYECKRVWG